MLAIIFIIILKLTTPIECGRDVFVNSAPISTREWDTVGKDTHSKFNHGAVAFLKALDVTGGVIFRVEYSDTK